MDGAGIGGDPVDLIDSHAQLGRGARRSALRTQFSAPAPRDQRSAATQEGCGVLDNHLQGAYRAGRRKLAATGPGRPGLGPGVYDRDVPDPAPRGNLLDERALAARGLEQHHLGLGTRDSEYQAGEPGAGANVHESARIRERRKVQRHQRVGEMILEHLDWLTNRGRSQGVGDHLDQESFEALGRPWRECETLR